MIAASHNDVPAPLTLVGDEQFRRHRPLKLPLGHVGNSDPGTTRTHHGHALHPVADVRPASQMQLQVDGALFPVGLIDPHDGPTRKIEIAAGSPAEKQGSNAGRDADQDAEVLPFHVVASPRDQTTRDGWGEA